MTEGNPQRSVCTLTGGEGCRRFPLPRPKPQQGKSPFPGALPYILLPRFALVGMPRRGRMRAVCVCLFPRSAVECAFVLRFFLPPCAAQPKRGQLVGEGLHQPEGPSVSIGSGPIGAALPKITSSTKSASIARLVTRIDW